MTLVLKGPRVPGSGFYCMPKLLSNYSFSVFGFAQIGQNAESHTLQ